MNPCADGLMDELEGSLAVIGEREHELRVEVEAGGGLSAFA